MRLFLPFGAPFSCSSHFYKQRHFINITFYWGSAAPYLAIAHCPHHQFTFQNTLCVALSAICISPPLSSASLKMAVASWAPSLLLSSSALPARLTLSSSEAPRRGLSCDQWLLGALWGSGRNWDKSSKMFMTIRATLCMLDLRVKNLACIFVVDVLFPFHVLAIYFYRLFQQHWSVMDWKKTRPSAQKVWAAQLYWVLLG